MKKTAFFSKNEMSEEGFLPATINYGSVPYGLLMNRPRQIVCLAAVPQAGIFPVFVQWFRGFTGRCRSPVQYQRLLQLYRLYVSITVLQQR